MGCSLIKMDNNIIKSGIMDKILNLAFQNKY